MSDRHWRRGRAPAALGAVVLAAACLGTPSPALPAVRWFDPLPEPPAADRDGGARAGAVRVTAVPPLGRELVVRVAAREVAFDAQNQWTLDPTQAVAVVVGRALAGTEQTVDVRIDAFELDVTAAPRAHVRLTVAGGDGSRRVVEAWADSPDRSPPSFAAAMAQALADVQAQLRPR